MTSFDAKVLENIPANRLLALAGAENDEDGWDTILLKPSELGWIPDFVTSVELEEDSIVSVSVRDNPVWRVEASQSLPAGTLVMCDVDGRVKHYRPEEGNHIGYTTHSVTEGEVVSFVRKYGHMPQNQVQGMGI